ncbi:hypothetical protein SAMN06313486_10110 [Epsilonproteobacteria bacterium SCGC AD-308-P11]|jgi:hypothetical protein|nr:hypothetical protein SAMN06313486_10110 [Epsilonproteobacteria bacterium SCGC AD-308-P11]
MNKDNLRTEGLMSRQKIKNSIKILVISLCVLVTLSIAEEVSSVNIKMNGMLDDDLFIMTTSTKGWDFKECFQMHNPNERFFLDGQKCLSQHISGWIDYDKNISMKKKQIILIALANEREESVADKKLVLRTHYKSSEVFVNNNILIPSMLPEKNDLPDAPLWFDINSDKNSYNYYNFWENAVINVGLIFSAAGIYNISLFNLDGELVASCFTHIRNTASHIKFKLLKAEGVELHELTEIDGGVFGIKGMLPPDDEKVRKCTAKWSCSCQY